MSSSILSIGITGLAAAQAGINTTGHNIVNSATPGYNRQQVVQTTAGGLNQGFGFLGSGTQVADVKRIYNDYLNNQVITTQSTKNQIDTYFSQISQINNQFADATSGLSPALQDFFNGVQDVASNPDSTPSRQAALSAAQSLTSRFQSLDGQLNDMRAGVNSQLTSTIATINTYATQISSLNQAIEAAQGITAAHPANDLLDQRDQVISDLSKQVAVSVVKQGNSYNVFIGTGQPLVVGGQVFTLAATTSPTDLSRTEVGYATNGVVTALSETSLSGGALGGLFDFRANTLDVTQNSLGRVAVGVAMTFNAQHKLGQDQNGALGGNFFNAAPPVVKVDVANPAGDAIVTATISNPSALTISDYGFQVTGPGAYQVTRLSDGLVTNITPPTTLPQTIDGVDFKMSAGPQTVGDYFVVQPTVNGASGIGVAITDTRKIAAAAPIRTSAPAANTGTGAIGPAAVTSVSLIPARVLTYAAGFLTGFPPLSPVTVTSGGVPTTYPAGTPVPYAGLAGDTITFDGVEISGIPAAGSTTVGPPNTTPSLTYNSATNTLSGFPAYLDVTVKPPGGGASVTYPAGTPAVYVPGATISYGGVNFTLSGSPNNGDTFTVASNPGGVGDNRNALLLAGLQTANTLATNTVGQSTTTYQGAYSQLISIIGNKTRELQVNGAAENALFTQAQEAQQSLSGVNLDEEATNLLRYQQAYQASGKIMQTANLLFDTILNLKQ